MAGQGEAWHEKEAGEGSPSFVWLHGWGQDLTAFERLSGLFGGVGHHRLFDQPGFGKTPIMNAEDGTQDYADRLAAILKGTGPHVFVGHSFGVRVSIRMAAQHPELVQAIVGIAGAGLKRKRSPLFRLKAMLIRNWGKLTRVLDRLFGTKLRAGFEERFGSADYKSAGSLRTTFVKTVNEDLSPVAAKAGCPVCLIYGEGDTETPPEFGARYAKIFKDAEFHEVPGFNHWDILDRGAYQCEAIIKRFLKKIDAT